MSVLVVLPRLGHHVMYLLGRNSKVEDQPHAARAPDLEVVNQVSQPLLQGNVVSGSQAVDEISPS